MDLKLIPQHKLKNSAGQPVDFDLLLWDESNQDYDVEKPHRHDFNEVLVFQVGGGTHDIDFNTYENKNQAIHFVASHNVHLVLRSKESRGCSLLFTGDFLSKELISQLPFSKNPPVLILTDKDFRLIDQLLEQIKTEFTAKLTGFESIIQAHLQAFMLHLRRVFRDSNPTDNKPSKPELIIRFLELIQQDFILHVSVEAYADKLNVSTKHLIDLCKTHTGKTPLKLINEITISEAKKLLFHTKLSIKEIAHQLNFEDPTNFSKYFKNATKYTPSEYREGIR